MSMEENLKSSFSKWPNLLVEVIYEQLCQIYVSTKTPNFHSMDGNVP